MARRGQCRWWWSRGGPFGAPAGVPAAEVLGVGAGLQVLWPDARLDRRRSWELFLRALRSDIADIQGGTTHEGIHFGRSPPGARAPRVGPPTRGFDGEEVELGGGASRSGH
jgi:hypothetical protein